LIEDIAEFPTIHFAEESEKSLQSEQVFMLDRFSAAFSKSC
jgi:hypothetical protein